MVTGLLTLRTQYEAKDCEDFILGPNYDDLKRYRLHDFIFKLRFDQLAQKIEQLLGDDLYAGSEEEFLKKSLNGKSVAIGFSNGTAFVEIFAQAKYREKVCEDAIPLVGVQLQHDRFRIVVRNVKENCAKQFLCSKSVEDIFPKNKGPGVCILQKEWAPKNDINKYGKAFFYRYVVINRIILEDLARLMINVCNELVDISSRAEWIGGGATPTIT